MIQRSNPSWGENSSTHAIGPYTPPPSYHATMDIVSIYPVL
jgi:hypothetical protein